MSYSSPESGESQNTASNHDENSSSYAVKQSSFTTARTLALLIGIADIVVLGLGGLYPQFLYWSLGSVAIITFLGILTLVNSASLSPEFNTGEMRKAIASSFVILYLIVLAVFVSTGFGSSGNEQSTEVINNVMTPLSYLMGAIAAFYFGEKYIEKIKKN